MESGENKEKSQSSEENIEAEKRKSGIPTNAIVTGDGEMEQIKCYKGKYQFDRSENCDEYLKALDCGLVLRKVQAANQPSLSIGFQSETNEWSFVFDSIFNKKTMNFKLGEEFQDESYDCRKCMTTMYWKDGKFVANQKCEEGGDVYAEFILEEPNLTMRLQCDGSVMSQHFLRIA